MIPIGDTNEDRIRTPYVNYLLLAINIFVFVYYQAFGSNEAFLMSFATIPEEILSGKDVILNGMGATPIPVYATIITSMFMHGGLAHLGGNLLYLWIFGDNLENRMGHLRYLIFYLLCGIIATLSHVLASSMLGKDLLIPSLGASGAISGVLGGYLLLFPMNRVRILAFLFVIRVPAFVTLGLWIGLQLLDGYNSMGIKEGGGVAYAAHIAGFAAGLFLVKFFVNKQNVVINKQSR